MTYLIAALIIIGCFLIFDISISSFVGGLSGLVDEIRNEYYKRKQKRHISLKRKVEVLSGEKKENFFVKNFSDAERILHTNKKIEKIKGVYIGSAVGIFVAVVISAILDNVFVLPPLAIGMALVPAWLVKITEANMRRSINDELETTLSCITASYMRTDNLVLAVEENLNVINAPISHAFITFYNENKLVNSNVIYGIKKLRETFDNTIFEEWCDAMIQCQSDRTLKATLYPIVRKFTDIKKVQAELDTAMMIPMQNFIIMTVTLVLMIPVIASLQTGWLDILFNTFGGKMLISATITIVIFGINKAINLSKPVEYKK